jgi:hypothetical protein
MVRLPCEEGGPGKQAQNKNTKEIGKNKMDFIFMCLLIFLLGLEMASI